MVSQTSLQLSCIKVPILLKPFWFDNNPQWNLLLKRYCVYLDNEDSCCNQEAFCKSIRTPYHLSLIDRDDRNPPAPPPKKRKVYQNPNRIPMMASMTSKNSSTVRRLAPTQRPTCPPISPGERARKVTERKAKRKRKHNNGGNQSSWQKLTWSDYLLSSALFAEPVYLYCELLCKVLWKFPNQIRNIIRKV